MKKRLFPLATALFLAGTAPVLAQTAPAAAHPQYGSFGVDLGARDLSVRPGDDFWNYANQGFMRAHPIPADRNTYGLGDVLSEQIEQQLREIVEHPSADAASRQVADFYASWMDEAGIEARGTAPLRPYLDRIAAVHDKAGLIALFATPGFASPINIGIQPNPADPTHYAPTANQGGLGMPGRDYYLREGADYDRYRAAYRAYLINLQRLAGMSDPEGRADRVIALEHRIAEAQWAPERQRDVTQVINPMNRAQLAAFTPSLDWGALLTASGLGNQQKVVVGETTAIQAAATMIDQVPLDTWKDYLTLHLLDNMAPYLPRAFDQARFGFRSHTLRGTEAQKARWKR